MFACQLVVVSVFICGAPEGNTQGQKQQEAADRYEQMFLLGKLDRGQLEFSDDLSVAVQAAWESSIDIRHRVDVCRISRCSIQRFLGMFESRIGMKVPKWWECALTHNDIVDRALLFHECQPVERFFIKCQIVEQEFRCDRETLFVEGRNDITVSIGSVQRKVPESIFRGHVLANVACCFTDEATFVAFADDIGLPYPVYCIDKEGNKRWEATAWGTAMGQQFPGGVAGGHYNFIKIRATPHLVVIFGGGSAGMFADGYGCDTGNELFHFSTSYWNTVHLPYGISKAVLRCDK